jgi:hypothetical protein
MSSASFPIRRRSSKLVGAILMEQDDEWAVAERRYVSAESVKRSETPLLSTTTQEILAAIGYLLLLTDGADQFPPLDGTLPLRAPRQSTTAHSTNLWHYRRLLMN